MRTVINRFRDWYAKLPDQKKYVEFVTALLSVPVLVTVIILNLNNLNQTNKKTPAPATPTTTVQIVISGPPNQTTPIVSTPVPTPTTLPTPTPSGYQCKQQVGPVEIVSPRQDEVITKENVCIILSTRSGEYCPVVWSYALNGGEWSQYTDKEICLYNLSSGKKQLQIRVKNASSGDSVLLERIFTYINPAPTLQPTTASTSADTQ